MGRLPGFNYKMPYFYMVTIKRRPGLADFSILRDATIQPNAITTRRALQNIVDYLDRHGLDKLVSNTQLMIAPGFEYRLVEAMITNFHQPQSTLLLLVSAFVGDDAWRPIYDYALKNGFRFLSYGDACLLRR